MSTKTQEATADGQGDAGSEGRAPLTLHPTRNSCVNYVKLSPLHRLGHLEVDAQRFPVRLTGAVMDPGAFPVTAPGLQPSFPATTLCVLHCCPPHIGSGTVSSPNKVKVMTRSAHSAVDDGTVL